MIDLKNKKILITGASSGIGRSTAILFSSLGAELFITGRNQSELLLTKNLCSGKVDSFSCDLCKEEDVLNLLNFLPSIDGMVHSAGKVLPVPVKFIQDKHLKDVFEVNFNSAVKICSNLLKAGKISDAASIVFISSISVLHSYLGGAPYISSKAALEGYARTLALELSSRKIRVNVIRPALVRTRIYELTKAAASSEEEVIKYEKNYPLGIGEPEDVAAACAFFVSSSSKWITGSFLNMDGGLTLGGK
ncbi:MAG: SDR family NAD(P)-dependent oxidoreductase [Bacteroidota bacterium]|jgi:NAD(P)-dependent dehydrogenase (short-subunit alcohol dehydrogenase family)